MTAEELSARAIAALEAIALELENANVLKLKSDAMSETIASLLKKMLERGPR